MYSQVFVAALFLHVVSFAISFGSMIVVDCAGLLWLTGSRGFRLGRVLRVADITQPLIWLGFVGLIASGVYMQWEIGKVDTSSIIKFGLVGALGVNGVVLHLLKKAFSEFPEEATPHEAKRYIPAMAVATAISQVGWWGAAIIGFTHAYIRDAVASPVSPVVSLCLFYGLWIIAAAVSGLYQRKVISAL
ncbi:MAG: hypothetical protein KBD66_04300 [Candidatus Doudnabacteria bacterium]|nr:hypothetical protein [Candidatus Doudnabacteria bacterium]